MGTYQRWSHCYKGVGVYWCKGCKGEWEVHCGTLQGPIHISSSGPFHTNSIAKVNTGPQTTTKGQHVHPTNHQVTGVLP